MLLAINQTIMHSNFLYLLYVTQAETLQEQLAKCPKNVVPAADRYWHTQYSNTDIITN